MLTIRSAGPGQPVGETKAKVGRVTGIYVAEIVTPAPGDYSSQLYELSATYAQPIERSEKRRLRGEVGELTVSVAEAQLADVLRQRLAPR